jgi:hypothetical protein
MKPFYPPFASERSIIGITKAFTNRFASLPTMRHVVERTGDNAISFLQQTKIVNQQIIDKIKSKKQENDNLRNWILKYNCTTTADNLREQHWKMEMVGQSQSSFFELHELKPWDHLTHDQKKLSIQIQLTPELKNATHPYNINHGCYNKYLGSETGERIRILHSMKLPDTPISGSVKKLVQLRAYALQMGGENLIKFIDWLIGEKSHFFVEFSEEERKALVGHVIGGGNTLHRMKCSHLDDRVAMSHNNTIASHIRFTPNSL